MTKRSAIEELLAEGMAQVQEGETLAKAAADALDKDFAGLDQARAASDQAHEDDQPDPDEDEPGEDPENGDPDPDEDEPDETPENGDPDQPEPGEQERIAKAAQAGGFIDAMPLLRAIDARLERLEGIGLIYEEVQGLKAQVGVIAKSVQASSQGMLTIAKAVAPNVDGPLPSRSTVARAKVPTTVVTQPTTETSAQVFSKAEQAFDAGRISSGDIALLNGMVNSFGVAGARTHLPQLFAQIDHKEQN